MKFTNLGSNILTLLLVSTLAWGGIFALFALWVAGASMLVAGIIALIFLASMTVCVCLMGLDIFRCGDSGKNQNVSKIEAEEITALEIPPKVPAQELDDFIKIAAPLVSPGIEPKPARPPILLPDQKTSLPTLAPLQQHALGGIIVRQLQPPATQSLASPPITKSIRPQESPAPNGQPLGK